MTSALAELNASARRFEELSQSAPTSDYAVLRARSEAIITHQPRLNAWTTWRRVQGEAVDAGLLPLVNDRPAWETDSLPNITAAM